MLKILNITKTYEMGSQKVKALKDISLEFRKNEFVSVLGPSGCGKTTLLNIIGGLDRYTSGDLIINNKSTKLYKDKDWDTYRNHSIGFVFQSYNLIPHQTVLENVELALTLSGISKDERKKRATRVLEKVGLKDKLNNKPNQLSGGQMQRVAIARALVNDPDIILADEPTGALDSTTSIQIMKLLKEISKDKLIIMVTHNPDLAKEYSSRIVKLLDGKLISDSNPYKQEKTEVEEQLTSMVEDSQLNKKQLKKKNKKKRMSFFTALALSFKNLLTKKGRTFLVSFAGSIGIIGISLILAISSGFSTYINKMQEDTLSSYPITVEAKSVDIASLILSFFSLGTNSNSSAKHEEDAIYPNGTISSLLSSVGATTNNLQEFYEYIQKNKDEISNYTSAIQYSYDVGLEFLLNNKNENDELKTKLSNKDKVYPKSTALYKSIIFYSLTYFKAETKVEISYNDETTNYTITKINDPDPEKSTDLDIVSLYLYGVGNKLEEFNTNGYTTLSEEEIEGIINKIFKNTIRLSDYKEYKSSAFYELIDNKDLINNSYETVAVSNDYNEEDPYQVILVLDENSEVDDYILYSLGFLSDNELWDLLNCSINKKPSTTKIDFNAVLNKKFTILTSADTYGKTPEEAYLQSTNYVTIKKIIRLKKDAQTSWAKPGVAYSKAFTDEIIKYINNSGVVPNIEEDNPTQIKIYVNTFEAKDKIKQFIADYNTYVKQIGEEGNEISYSDMAGTIMSTVSSIITAITYVLIAFVSVSLIVSSIMIGIITYISVIERTKEIGVLRSVGASKKDVKRVFTAESFIIGLTSGVFGIVVSIILILPINLVLKSYTGIAGLASLPVLGAIVLILVSILLTLISGLIPARAASKKDPVVALRTE